MDAKMEAVLKSLNGRGFLAEYAENAEQARQKALEYVKDANRIGIGGSMTIVQTGIYDALVEKGYEIFSATHAAKTGGSVEEAFKNAFDADWYLLSSNAVTMDGRLVNIDGRGNRVAAMIYGPDNVLFVVGKNKIAEDYAAAIARIKKEACPPNTRRLGLNTPCSITGECVDCQAADRICNVTVALERPTRGKKVRVIMIDEAYGF